MKQSTDFLVIGSGIAGLCFAIHASRFGKVVMVTKKNESESNTNYAQGGIACVLDPDDSFDSHLYDTLTTGRGLSHEQAVKILVGEGPDRIKELLEWGAAFTLNPSSAAYASLDLWREGGHSKNRIVHAHDLTGKIVEETLLARVTQQKNITLYENSCLVDLITNHHINRSQKKENSCYGAYVFDSSKKKVVTIQAKITFLATGGVGQVYKHTSNPAIATGDGVACAYRAGAQIRNMEFNQFHPTTLYHIDANSFLISETLRGYGAVLKDIHEQEFMSKYDSRGSLAPRDVVAQAIDNEMKVSGEKYVYLDIRHAPADQTRKRFPTIYAKCKEYGIDITKDLIPVVPASHYMCGGIYTDTFGATTIRNLYAGGEVACTGVHGANRLASNSLLEALVFSKRSAQHAAETLKHITPIPAAQIPAWDDSGTVDNEEWILISHNLLEIKCIMWDYVGIVRSNLRLRRAQRRIKLIEKETELFYRKTKISVTLLELRNIITVAKLIVTAALKRHESRGLHYTTDYPEQNDQYWKRDTIISRLSDI